MNKKQKGNNIYDYNNGNLSNQNVQDMGLSSLLNDLTISIGNLVNKNKKQNESDEFTSIIEEN